MKTSAFPQQPAPTRRPSWHDFAGRFADERDCLASFLALEAAEVLAGAKPANLVTLVDRSQPCGRNLYRLWRQLGPGLLEQSGLAVRVLVERETSDLLFIYRPEALDALLERPNITAFLGRAGYRPPAGREEALQQLQERFGGPEFPHEIGVFLGYPLKDVAGFMGWGRLAYSCQGPWKIYGAPQRSLELAAAFRECRCRMAGHLARSASAVACLQSAAFEEPLFWAVN